MSSRQKPYLSKKFKAHSLIGFFITLIVWWVVSHALFTESLYLSTPEETFKSGLEIISLGHVFFDIESTLFRTMVAFLISVILAVPLGLILGVNKDLQKSTEPLVDFWRSIPSTALFPLFLLVFGINDISRIGISAFVSFWIILLMTKNGVNHSSRDRLRLARVMKFTKYQEFKDVILWEALPYIFSGMRTALPICFIIVLISEMSINPRYGIGVAIIEAQQTFKIADMYFLILLSGVLGYLLNKIFRHLEAKFIHWT